MPRHQTQQYRVRYHVLVPARSRTPITGSSTASTRSHRGPHGRIIESSTPPPSRGSRPSSPNRLVKHSGRVIPKGERRADLPCAPSIMRHPSPETEKLLCLIRMGFLPCIKRSDTCLRQSAPSGKPKRFRDDFAFARSQHERVLDKTLRSRQRTTQSLVFLCAALSLPRAASP